MAIVRVHWRDAVGQWDQTWVSLQDICDELSGPDVTTVGHLIEDHGLPYVVVAASVSAYGDRRNVYGGVFAIPVAMVTSTEILE